MSRLIFFAGLAWTGALVAVPSVGDVEFSYDAATRTGTVTYALAGEPAVVTVSLTTNGVPVPSSRMATVWGSVNRVVQPGESLQIGWQADRDWPDAELPLANARPVVSVWPTNAPPPYMVVDLGLPNAAESFTYYADVEALPDGGLANDIYRTDRLVFRKCDAAGKRWNMGSPSSEAYRCDDVGNTVVNEGAHSVVLSQDYYFTVFTITQSQYRRVMGTNPSAFKNDADSPGRPVETVSYQTLRGAGVSCANAPAANSAIARFRSATGLEVDLPTEAQWEYAGRAGCTAKFYDGTDLSDLNTNGTQNTSANLDRLAWYQANSGSRTHRVGEKAPNAWGIYDMIGNVWEWTRDGYADGYDASEVDPAGNVTAGVIPRTVRGAAWNIEARGCRVARRGGNGELGSGNQRGFRLVAPARAR